MPGSRIIRLPGTTHLSAVLPPVSRCVRLSAGGRPCTPPRRNRRDLGRFPRGREADESEAGERAGDNAAPGSPTSARSAGSFRLFAAGTIRRVERAVGPYDAEKLRCGKGSQRGLDEKRSGFTEVRKQKNEEGVLFEVYSAISTVGMTTGITRDLNTAGRIIIIIMMYCGRIGSMTFVLSFVHRPGKANIELPEEKVIIG